MKKDKFIDQYVSSFIDYVIEKKLLQFSINDIKLDNSLFDKSILKFENNTISIIDYNKITYCFLEKYKLKLDFKINQEFNKNIDFINDIKKDFLSNGYIYNFHLLEKGIWKCLIVEANSKFRSSCNKHLKLINEDNYSDLINFIEAYSQVLPVLNLSDSEIFENFLIQIELISNNTDYPRFLWFILNGIKNKCKTDYDLGLVLLDKSLLLNGENENLISALISGLYENKRKEFYKKHLKKIIKNENKLHQIFFGLSNISDINDEECKLFIELIKKFIIHEKFIIPSISIIISILKSNNLKHHNFCFTELESAIKNENAANYIINNFHSLENYYLEKTEIIKKLIYQPYFSIEKDINKIGNFLWYQNDFNSFKQVVLTIIENKPFEKFIKSFKIYLSSVDKLELDPFMIELLTDNQANKRIIGLEIFDELSIRKPYKFSINILTLSDLTQYKLWVSLTQEFHDPKNRITALLPLINSKNKFIKESFQWKLQEISEDYGGHITEILEENYDKDNPIYISFSDDINEFIKLFYNEFIYVKNSVKELNPYYTNNKHINHFNNLFSKKMNGSISKSADENSLLKILGTNTVQLSKGGGWKIGTNKEISNLSEIKLNIKMPRSYFIDSNKYEIDIGILRVENWEEEMFTNIITFIENEK